MDERLIEECCGCGLCEVVCPKGCIQKKKIDRNNIVYIKSETCIHCGICDRICPIKVSCNHNSPKLFYKAITKRDNAAQKSSSGGIAYELSCAVINSGGCVFGAGWSIENQRVEHVCVDRIIDMTYLQGSKYVQSIILEEVYKSIKERLKKGSVLFIGTPCQVQAVKNYTKNNCNLTCIDLICHGVPSPDLLAEQLKCITPHPIKDISFRDKHKFRLKVFDGNKEYEYFWQDIPYYALYMNFASLREYCYHCKFATNQRVGDITLGDFVEYGKLYSCVTVNTSKGMELFKRISEVIAYEERDKNIVKRNHAFYKPTTRHPKTDRFTELYLKQGLTKAYKKTFRLYRYKRMIKKYSKILFGAKCYELLKRVKAHNALGGRIR